MEKNCSVFWGKIIIDFATASVGRVRAVFASNFFFADLKVIFVLCLSEIRSSIWLNLSIFNLPMMKVCSVDWAESWKWNYLVNYPRVSLHKDHDDSSFAGYFEKKYWWNKNSWVIRRFFLMNFCDKRDKNQNLQKIKKFATKKNLANSKVPK